MIKIKKRILQVNIFPHPGTIAMNSVLNNNDYKCDYLTMYPLFKLNSEFKKKNTIIKKSLFSTFICTLYFFLYRYEKYNFIKKINSFVQKKAYSTINNFIIKNIDNYDIFIIQASLGRGSLPYLKNKITLLDKWSAHVNVEKKISAKEFTKRNIKIPYDKLGSSNNFQYNEELNEYKLVDKIVVPSTFAYKTFIDEGFKPNNLHIVEMSGSFAKDFYPTSYPNKETFEVVYVGRLTLNKGIAYLIEAFKKVKIKNKRLRMFGIMTLDGKEYFKNTDLSDNIEILSTVKFQELKNIYSKSDVLVQPSLFDGWSMVVSEALASGCPVITTPNTGASDIIKDKINGYVVPIMDADAIAECLNKIYEENNKLTFDRDCIAKSVAEYKDWNKYSSDYKDLIENITSNKIINKIKKRILQVTVFPHPGSIAMNSVLNNNDYKCDYLTMYPLFKLNSEFKKKNTIIKKSLFSTFICTLYFFLYRYEKYNFIKKINSFVQKKAYSTINNFIIKNIDNYDIFIIQASLGRGSLPYLKNKITLLDKWSAHVNVEKKISAKEFTKRNIKIPYDKLGSSNNFQYNEELNEYKLVDKIVVPSTFAYKTFIDEGFKPNNLHIVEMSGSFAKDFYPTSYPNKETFEVVYVGRLTLNKGIAYLIEAFKKVKIKNKRLRMFGIMTLDGKEYFKNTDLSDNIEILSTVKFQELKNIYSKSDVLVQPSLFDGWSMVVSEALASGCPVITTPNTGASDIIKDKINGYVVPIMDADAIAECLNKIYEENNKLTFDRDCIAKSVAEYKDWNKYSSDYKDLIETF